MALTTAFRDFMAGLVIGETLTPYNNANAYLGAGGGAGATTAFVAAQTDLQGASKTRKAMSATYPQRSTNVLTFRALFITTDANYLWDEWGVFNAAAAGTMMSRKVENLGTKVNTQNWELTVTITILVS